MSLVKNLLYLAVFLFFIVLIIRMVFELIQSFARDWRPTGVVLVAAEGVYTATDPPLRALRRVVPTVRLGGLQFDVAITLLFIILLVLMRVLS